MIHIWWPAFVVPVLMILCGLLPGLHYRSPGGALDEERQRFADGQKKHKFSLGTSKNGLTERNFHAILS